MNDIIKFCEQNLSDSEINRAKEYFKNASSKSYKALSFLCRGKEDSIKKDLMAEVIRRIVYLEKGKIIDQKYKKILSQKPKSKNPKRDFHRQLKQLLNAINIICIFDPSQDHAKLLFEAIQYLQKKYKQSKQKEPSVYNDMMRWLFELLRESTPTKKISSNAILISLSNLLNELGCTSPQNKTFTRQILQSLISS